MHAKKKMNHLYDVILMFHYYQPKKNFGVFETFLNTLIILAFEVWMNFS